MEDFLESLKHAPLVSYGAISTIMLERGFDLSGSLAQWFLDHPDDMRWITNLYLEAGSKIISACGFHGGPWGMEDRGRNNRLFEINCKMTEKVREITPKECCITGSILPTGKLLKPLGEVDPEVLFLAYQAAAAGYAEGGADAVWVMTMMDMEEATIAVKAVKESTDLPIIASMAFNITPKGAFTAMGIDPKTAATQLVEAGADVVGHNCGEARLEDVTPILKQMREVTDKPLVVKPNAGKPELANGKTRYLLSPQQFTTHVADWVAAGARILGGCCGSTPAHAAAIKEALKD